VLAKVAERRAAMPVTNVAPLARCAPGEALPALAPPAVALPDASDPLDDIDDIDELAAVSRRV
jgi:hypothetical protein